MDPADRHRIDKIRRDRSDAHETLLSHGSPTYGAFLRMERAAFADGRLPKMHKELIAVGISLILNCESCLEWHISQALTAGASQEQVLEAVEVGIEMGGGPATVAARFALKVLEYHAESNGAQ